MADKWVERRFGENEKANSSLIDDLTLDVWDTVKEVNKIWSEDRDKANVLIALNYVANNPGRKNDLENIIKYFQSQWYVFFPKEDFFPFTIIKEKMGILTSNTVLYDIFPEKIIPNNMDVWVVYSDKVGVPQGFTYYGKAYINKLKLNKAFESYESKLFYFKTINEHVAFNSFSYEDFEKRTIINELVHSIWYQNNEVFDVINWSILDGSIKSPWEAEEFLSDVASISCTPDQEIIRILSNSLIPSDNVRFNYGFSHRFMRRQVEKICKRKGIPFWENLVKALKNVEGSYKTVEIWDKTVRFSNDANRIRKNFSWDILKNFTREDIDSIKKAYLDMWKKIKAIMVEKLK